MWRLLTRWIAEGAQWQQPWSNELLLAAPQYGERWASVWLDLVRYADSKGLGLDGRREIWKYRDRAIDAYNSDMPFDQFTIRQLAGDLLDEPPVDDLVATAANRLTQSNDEGGTDDEEFPVLRVPLDSNDNERQDAIDIKLDRVIGDEPHPFKDPDQSLNVKSSDGFAAYTRIHYPRTAVFVLASPMAMPAFPDPLLPIQLKIELEHRVNVRGAFALVSRRGNFAISAANDPPVRLHVEDLAANRKHLAKLRTQRRAIASTSVPIMRERPKNLSRPTHVFTRGLFLTKGDHVSPGVPASMPPLNKIDDPDRYRRSVSTYTKRSIPYPMFAAFDAPSREFCTPRRLRSNTLLQALTTFNDTTFVECAEAHAGRMLAEHQKIDEQLRFGFVTVTTRTPTETELTALRSLYQTCLADGDAPGDAMQTVSAVLLNLDEIMSK